MSLSQRLIIFLKPELKLISRSINEYCNALSSIHQPILLSPACHAQQPTCTGRQAGSAPVLPLHKRAGPGPEAALKWRYLCMRNQRKKKLQLSPPKAHPHQNGRHTIILVGKPLQTAHVCCHRHLDASSHACTPHMAVLTRTCCVAAIQCPTPSAPSAAAGSTPAAMSSRVEGSPASSASTMMTASMSGKKG